MFVVIDMDTDRTYLVHNALKFYIYVTNKVL
jgi:hypothetical protein